jgi:hypothetical protein
MFWKIMEPSFFSVTLPQSLQFHGLHFIVSAFASEFVGAPELEAQLP